MRLDDDVGKVAQVTPVLISKALEIFMQKLIDETCLETRNRNAKKMSATHLKTTINNTDKFDFLVDIVEKIPDAAAGNEEDVSDKPKRKGRGKAKDKGKKKDDGDEEGDAVEGEED